MTWGQMLLMSSSNRQGAVWHLGAKHLACEQASVLQPSINGTTCGKHMADPNGCKISLMKVLNSFNCTTCFKLYHKAHFLSSAPKKHNCSALNYLVDFKSRTWNISVCEPDHHSSCPYKVHPLSFVFWDKIGVDKPQVLTSDHLTVQKAEPLFE